MRYSHIPTAQLRRYRDSIPVPTHMKDHVCNQWKHWCEHSGVEWTVARYKDLKACIVKTYATNERINPRWFATTSAGNLKGPFGKLFNFALMSDENLKATLYLLNIYTSVSRIEVEEDLLDGIRAEIMPETTEGPMVWLKENSSEVYHSLKRHGLIDCLRVKPCEPLVQVAPGKSSHALKVRKDLVKVLNHPLWEQYEDVLEGAVGVELEGVRRLKYSGMSYVGEVHITHEPGLKTRYFAAPNLVLQRCLEPLKIGLMDVVRELPWDCTHNHRKGDDAIQARLASGEHVHSVDMSKATDNFPWSFQKQVLSWMCSDTQSFTHRLCRLFTSIVDTGLWKLGDEQLEKAVWWTKGQPLGLGPSFPLFALCHGILLDSLSKESGVEGKFFVLGDDVVILDDELVVSYRQSLLQFGVEVSEMKTLSSTTLAQFGGATLTKSRSFWTPKWRSVNTENKLDVAAWWYPGATSGKYSDLINRILALPPPWGTSTAVELSPDCDWALFQAMKEEADLRAEKVIPSAVVPRVSNLLDSEDLITLQTLGGILKSEEWTSNYKDLLKDGSVAPYPKMRKRVRNRDPYTLGTMSYWTGVFARAEVLRLQAQERS